MGTHAHRLSACALGVAMGVSWALGILVVGLVAMQNGWGKPFVDLFGSIYIGYTATVQGSFVGAGWALLDGFVCGVIFGWVYNLTLRLCCGKCAKKCD